MKRVFLLMGSNIGDSADMLRQASAHISGKAGRIIQKSAIYFSEPWGYESKNSYFNQCLEIETSLLPQVLLENLLEIERQMGRERNYMGYADREMDIDILLYGDEIINNANLIIPHPRLHLRKFALVPLNEIAEGIFHPVLNKKISDLLGDCTDASDVKRIN